MRDPIDYASTRLTVLDVLVILAKHKKTILLIVLLCAVLAVAVSLALPNEYTSRAVLLSPVEEESAAQMLMGQLGVSAAMGRGVGLTNPLQVYVAMLESDTLRDRLVDKFHLRDVYHQRTRSRARDQLASHTDVEVTKDGTLSIQFRGRNPEFAAAIASAYVDELRNLMHDLSSAEAAQRRDFFNQQLADAKTELDQSEAQLRDTQARTGVLQLDLQAKAVVEEEAQLRAAFAAKELQIASMRSYLTESNPSLAQAKYELESLRGQLDAAERKAQSPQGDLLIAASKMPQAGMDYIRALREVSYRQQLVEQLARQYEDARLDEGRQMVFVRVLDQPQVPDRKSGPSRSLIVLITVLGCSFVVATFFVIREINRRIAQDPNQGAKLQLLKAYTLGGSPEEAELAHLGDMHQ